jgi:serine/threonine protein phosphatase PrpC
VNEADGAFDALVADARLGAPHELPGLSAGHAAPLGAVDVLVYLVDLQQRSLVPFFGALGPATGQREPIEVDGTVAGHAFQHLELMTQQQLDGRVRVWLPLQCGTERLGVLALSLAAEVAEDLSQSLVGARLRRFVSRVAELVMNKTMYGDTIVRLRRQAEMGLAAELQWSLLPPLTFTGRSVTVAGALEPAYQVAGDSLDYAVDDATTRAAVFDGMGHGLRSAQLAAIAIAAYRNARRSGRSLLATAAAIHQASLDAFADTVFTTGVLVELHSGTGMLSWINAGHPEPLLLRRGKLVKALRCRPTLPMGLRIESRALAASVEVGYEQLEPGDLVLLYSDGVTEARSPNGDFFGEQRLTDLLTRNLAAQLPVAETMRRMIRSLLEHQQGQLSDDATLLLLEWRNNPDAN